MGYPVSALTYTGNFHSANGGHAVRAVAGDGARCGAEERCEAFTLRPHTGSCELFEQWGLTNRSATATSGEPLSQWVRPPRLHGR